MRIENQSQHRRGEGRGENSGLSKLYSAHNMRKSKISPADYERAGLPGACFAGLTSPVNLLAELQLFQL